MKLQNRLDSYDSKNLHELYLAQKHGVPNITLQEFDRYGWERIKFFRHSCVSLQIQGLLTGHFTVEFRCSFSIPNILWWYTKVFVWFEEKYNAFLFHLKH